MKQIEIRVVNRGFLYKVDCTGNISLSFKYFAIGVGGKFQSGEIISKDSSSQKWKKVDVDFTVMHVGITSLSIESSVINKIKLADEQPDNNAFSISRRDIIKRAATASVLLTGAIVFPTASTAQVASLLPGDTHGPFQANQESETYNPYDATYAPSSNEF